MASSHHTLGLRRWAALWRAARPWMRSRVGRYCGSPSGNNTWARAERAAAGSCPIGNGAVTSAVLVHLRVEPAHFDWRWRERPARALLAWEACLAIRWRGYAASKWSQRQLILGDVGFP